MTTIKNRKSGIELIKIIAIFLIIISHVTQTLCTEKYFNNLHFSDGYYILTATTDISVFSLVLLRYLGALGNLIFVISSSYFLSDIKKSNKKKAIKIGINTIIISLIFLAIYLLNNMGLSKNDIIKSIFPLTYQSNWFITVYLLFYLTVPYLNIIIEKLNKKQLFSLSFTLFVLYFGIAFIKSSFELNNLIIFITIYFMVNYFKKYMETFWNNKKTCIILLLLGILALFLLQFFTNVIGLKFSSWQNKQTCWVVNNNPILFLIAISLFYLFRKMEFKSTFINSISALSLYIYLIHENLLFRLYTRVYIWHHIYEKVGYTFIVLKILLYSLLLFVVSVLISFIYRLTIDRIVRKFIEKVFNNVSLNNK